MSSSMEKTEAAKRDALAKIVADARTVFFVSEAEGMLHGRPMANAKVEEGMKAIWFATQRNSGKVSEIKKDHKVLLGYTNASGSEWASVNGMADVVDDRAKVKELWNMFWKNWFEGPEDPNILLIKVTPVSAEYWDSGSRAIAMIKFSLAAVTGVKFDEGENEKLKL